LTANRRSAGAGYRRRSPSLDTVRTRRVVLCNTPIRRSNHPDHV